MKVYNDLGQTVLDNAWAGYNTSLFAYGQTGSGKSWSIVGYSPNRGKPDLRSYPRISYPLSASYVWGTNSVWLFTPKHSEVSAKCTFLRSIFIKIDLFKKSAL